ncbi:hypothetical protein ACDH70_18055 [Xanthomonas axonopodis pv. poinsettiicola]|uniref:hypothetical protein n=1 Tax=Xanthomonas TaxID=338 RepID=UPI001E2B97C3|nr:hypothetical protein [Xanthomonas codiaei]MCC8539338.1 hypothetical protein [Xanthomonas codiaei]
MPLFTLTVRHALDWFSTQLAAPDARAIVMLFFDTTYPAIREGALGPLAPDVNAADLVLFIPLEGLANAWTATAARGGKYVEVVCSRTSGDDRA